ncbi:MAG: hypothetical protein HZB26_01215 [Candidatus Hydrogenedentes bacterium]|nr:hypothetical protein [Candidatus Hydrogenedentota bacterium]
MARTGCWTLLFLAALDIAVNVAFRYPERTGSVPPGFLTRYFEYGRSIEGKLSRMVGPDDASSDPVALAGWLDPESWKDLPSAPSTATNVLIANYGMSFSFDVGRTLQKINPRYEMRCIGGPTAPVSHSYAAFTLDRTRHQAKIVLIGILASSVRGLVTMTGQTWAFESPYPYTYPRYRVTADGKLDAMWPMITSMNGLREALAQPEKWAAFVQQLRENDDYYNPFLFRHNVLDAPVTVRLLRRGWGQHQNSAVLDTIHTDKGFRPDSPALPVLKAIVRQFAETARTDGRLPIVLLLNDQGYSDHLYKALEPTLRDGQIPYVSTHEVAPAADLANFVADGHFTDAAYQRIAQLLEKVIQENLK